MDQGIDSHIFPVKDSELFLRSRGLFSIDNVFNLKVRVLCFYPLQARNNVLVVNWYLGISRVLKCPFANEPAKEHVLENLHNSKLLLS